MTATALQGIVPNLDEAEYHAHPFLSSTGARKLLQSPAKYRWALDHPEPPRKEFDIGTAVHSKVLGTGAPLTVIPEEHLSSNGTTGTNAARAFIQDARAAGKVPVKQGEADVINAMVESVLAHPLARSLFEQSGLAEASLFGRDPDSGVDMRCRFDYLPDFTVDDPCAVDLKTARDASPEGFAKAVAEHRYDIQDEFYLLLYAIITGDFTMPMKFVVVEKEPPFLVGVYGLAQEFLEMGRRKVREALDLFAACTTADVWPGYPLNPDPLQPPTWLMFQEGAIA